MQGLNYHRTWLYQVNGPHSPNGPKLHLKKKMFKGFGQFSKNNDIIDKFARACAPKKMF